jgi:hypothetical protein
VSGCVSMPGSPAYLVDIVQCKPFGSTQQLLNRAGNNLDWAVPLAHVDYGLKLHVQLIDTYRGRFRQE